MSSDTRRIDEIEYLRAIAILFTLFLHLCETLLVWPNETFHFVFKHFTFWGGVDLFFVISGFVIARSFKKQMDQAVQSSHLRTAVSFWVRRAWRILPAAWFWLAIFLIATEFFNKFGTLGDLKQNFTDSVMAFAQVANYYGVKCFGVKTVACGPNGIYWSLSLEEQFYLLLPLAIFLFRKNFVPFLVLALAVQFFWSRPIWSLAWAFRTDAFIWGVLLAIWSEHASYKKWKPVILKKISFLRWIVVFILLLVMTWIPVPENGVPLATSILGLVCAILVFLASYNEGLIFKKSAFRNIFVWLGSRSYSIYLCHIVIIRIVLEIFLRVLNISEVAKYTTEVGKTSWIFMAVAVPAVLLASEASYRFIEQPLRNYGRKVALNIVNKN